MKYLNEILDEHGVIDEVYPPFPEDEKRFKEKHTITKFKNFYSSPEYDALFKGASMKEIDRHKDNHGFNDNEDEKFYESFNEFIGELVEDGYTDKEILALAEEALYERWGGVALAATLAGSIATTGAVVGKMYNDAINNLHKKKIASHVMGFKKNGKPVHAHEIQSLHHKLRERGVRVSLPDTLGRQKYQVYKNIVGESYDEDGDGDIDSDQLTPKELRELHAHLTKLKNHGPEKAVNLGLSNNHDDWENETSILPPLTKHISKLKEAVQLDDKDINDPNFQKALTGFKKVYGKYVDEYGQESAVRHAKDMLEKNYDPNIRNKIETYLGLNEVVDMNVVHAYKATMRTAKDFPGGVHAVLGPLAALSATYPHLVPHALGGAAAAVAATAAGIKLANSGKSEDKKYEHPVVKRFMKHYEDVKNEMNESSPIATQDEEDEFPSKAVKRFRELSKNPSSNGLKLGNGSKTNNDTPTAPREDQEIKRTNEDVVNERNTNGSGGKVLSYGQINKKGTGQAPNPKLHHILNDDGTVHIGTNETKRVEEHLRNGGIVYFRPGHDLHVPDEKS